MCTAIGGFGSAPGQIAHPSGVAADSQDRVIISDRDNYRFQICDLNGACVAFGEFGSGPGQFKQLEAVAVDDQNRIYVADVVNQNIQIFQATYADDQVPFQINPGLNGSWANFDTLGQGFFIDVLPDIPLIFFAWFTWETAQAAPAQFENILQQQLAKPGSTLKAIVGDDNHRWMTAQGPYSGNTTQLDVTLTTGGLFDNPQPVTNSSAGTQGTITLTFHDCRSGTVDYNFTAAGVSGSVPIQRLAEDNVELCQTINAAAQETR